MSTRSQLLSPRMSGLLQRIQRAQRTPLHAQSPSQARVAYEAAAEILDLPRAKLPQVADLSLPAADGALLPARLYKPVDAPALPAMLYLHGGGFVIGSLETHDSLCRQLALRSGAAVLALDYRLAPEHRFPIAVDDAWAALRWLQTQGASIGIDTGRLAVGGDSAGGTLAAVCALLARDHDLPLAAQLLVTPGTSAYGETASRRLFANGFLLDAATIAWFFDHYIDHAHRADWRFAPLRRDDVEGVAPACVILAECDPLVDEGVAYADHLRAAGVAVSLELYRGLTHDFIKMGRVLQEASEAMQAAADFLREAFDA
jgi:acetyl esterase